MTDCNLKPPLLASLGRKKIHADFDGGCLTSDAGAVLLRQVDRKIGLIDAINNCIPDPRNQLLVIHEQRTLLAQRIMAIAMGYEDLNDHDTLRNDPLLQLLTERAIDAEQPLASSPTLCRLENRITRKSLVEIARVIVEQFIASHATPPEELVLDFDPTDDLLHGNQENRFFHGYYDNYCYLPLYVFCGDQLLAAYLRPSNIDGAKHSRAILKLLVTRFREVWPEVNVVFRADSGFCRWRLLRWCERNNVDYIVGLARNPVLERLAEPWRQRAQARFQETGEKQRIFGEFHYAAGTWDRPRRVITKAEQLAEGPNNRFIVSNLPGDPQTLYDKLYCQRGDMENRIKEQQLGLFADRTSCHAFLANQFRLLLSAAGYVLIETLRRVGLAGTDLARAQVTTIRLKVLKIGARITWSVRRIVLHLASGYPLKELFWQVASRLEVPGWPTAESG